VDGTDNFMGNPFRSAVSRQQQGAINQLVQSTAKVHHIDEMFLQLTRILVQRFGIWIAQVWADRPIDANQRIVELRALATRDILLPPHVLENHQLVMMAERILHEQRTLFYLPVDHTFSPHYATLLKRQGLYYCIGHFSQRRAARLPEGNGVVDRKVSTALAVAFLLFFQHLPPQKLLATIGFTLEQAMEAAQNSGLLHTAQVSAKVSANLSRQETFSQLAKLIPGRLENAYLMRFTNPLAGSVDIQDKLARRLYAVVDGRRSVEELSALASLTWSEMYHALRILLAQERVRLYTPDGQPVDHSLLLGNEEG
jgi:hypothetical protein